MAAPDTTTLLHPPPPPPTPPPTEADPDPSPTTSSTTTPLPSASTPSLQRRPPPQLFSRFGLANPFASGKLATDDKNSRRKSSTKLLGATEKRSPGFKMSRVWKGKGRRDSAGAAAGGENGFPCAGGSVEGSEDAVQAVGKKDLRKRSSTMGSFMAMVNGGGGAVRGEQEAEAVDGGGEERQQGRVGALKRSASSGSLGKMIGEKLRLTTGKAKGADAAEKREVDGGEERTGSVASGVGLSRSNAVTSRGHSRKSSWRSSWGFAGGADLSSTPTDTTEGSNRNSANSTGSHISFASTDDTDRSGENGTSSGIKGFGRRKTSSTLHGIAGGKGLGLGFGTSGLEMTPADKKDDDTTTENDAEPRPNTCDGVFTTTAAVDATATPASTSTDHGDPATAASHKKNSVGSAAESLTRRIKMPRLKQASSADNDTTAGRVRSRSETASTLLAAPANFMRHHRPFLNHNSGGASAERTTTNASTTALRGYSTSSESGVGLPSAAARNSGFASAIGHPAGVTCRSSPNLLVMSDESGRNGSKGKKNGSGGGIVDAGDRTTAAWFSTASATEPPPMLPALLPSEEYLLGEVFAAPIDSVFESGGAADERRGSSGLDVGEWGVGRSGGEGQKDKHAVERVLEHRKKAVASALKGAEEDEQTLKAVKGASSVELAKEAEAGADEYNGVRVEVTPADSKRSKSTTPRPPNNLQVKYTDDAGTRGRTSLADPRKGKHKRTVPSQSSSVYSAPNTLPPTPSDTSDIPQSGYAGNEYAKEIETELVDDRWVEYGPMDEVRAL